MSIQDASSSIKNQKFSFTNENFFGGYDRFKDDTQYIVDIKNYKSVNYND